MPTHVPLVLINGADTLPHTIAARRTLYTTTRLERLRKKSHEESLACHTTLAHDTGDGSAYNVSISVCAARPQQARTAPFHNT